MSIKQSISIKQTQFLIYLLKLTLICNTCEMRKNVTSILPPTQYRETVKYKLPLKLVESYKQNFH